MHRSPARWTRAFTAAALLTLPASAFAQTQPPAPTAQPQPQPQPQAQPQTPSQPQDTKVDASAAKQALSSARDTLSQLTSMPEAAKLQGETRTQVSTLISNFNELITTQADWRAAYAKVDTNLSALLGPEGPDAAPPASGVSGAVGTSGATSTTATTLDPAVRAKLVQFRTQLKEFEKAAGGDAGGAMATTPPANPSAPPASDVTPASPTAAMPAADQAKAADQGAQAEVTKHLDAISAILDQSKTGTLTKTQTSELKKHVTELRALLAK
jgi:hypothetical protein